MSVGLTRKAVSRTERDPLFVGFALSAWMKKEGLTVQRAAEVLEVSPDGLDKLALCLMPDHGLQSFPVSVDRIASHAGCDPDRLLTVLRDFGVTRVFAEKYANAANMLMAARDKKKTDPK